MRFKFRNKTWSIILKKELRSLEGMSCLGLCDYDANTIYLETDQPLKQLYQTLDHELHHMAHPYLSEEVVAEWEEVRYRVFNKINRTGLK